MKLQQEFTLDRPRDEVWAFFHDVPAVADCLPGAEYSGQNGEGAHTGRMAMKVGPFQAAFEGAAQVVYDEAAHRVAMEGKGVDKKGASRGKMKMDCSVEDVGGKTRVGIDADVQLSGTIAQFGRTGIIQEIASVLIADFMANVEQALAPASATPEKPSAAAAMTPAEAPAAPVPRKAPIRATRLLWLSLRGWIRGKLGLVR